MAKKNFTPRRRTPSTHHHPIHWAEYSVSNNIDQPEIHGRRRTWRPMCRSALVHYTKSFSAGEEETNRTGDQKSFSKTTTWFFLFAHVFILNVFEIVNIIKQNGNSFNIYKVHLYKYFLVIGCERLTRQNQLKVPSIKPSFNYLRTFCQQIVFHLQKQPLSVQEVNMPSFKWPKVIRNIANSGPLDGVRPVWPASSLHWLCWLQEVNQQHINSLSCSLDLFG